MCRVFCFSAYLATGMYNMKICFDRTPTFSVENDDCSADCARLFPLAESFSGAVSQYFHTCMLQQAEPLYKQRCAEDWWLVCHPTGQGRIAVLDQEAFSLLEQ